MRFSFDNTTPQEVIQRMTKELKTRELDKRVTFDLSKTELVVTIRRLGRSRLVFDIKSSDKGHEFSLREQQTALAHRPFRTEVEKLIQEVVDDLGGHVAA